jgi:phospholipid/cholesterol/gamma-HCH transport system substrate-binding protein
MNYRKLEIVVGAFMLVGIAAIAFLALKIGAGSQLGTDTYLVHARFSDITGITRGTNVNIAGVLVGRVEGVHLDENLGAIVDFTLRSDIKLSSDSIVSVRSSGLIGDSFLTVRPGGETDVVPPGGTFTMTEPPVDLMSLIGRFAFGSVDNKEDKQ